MLDVCGRDKKFGRVVLLEKTRRTFVARAAEEDAEKMGGLYVVKRDGREEPVAFDKITARIKKLAYGLSQEFCDPVRVRCRRLRLNRERARTAAPRSTRRRWTEFFDARGCWENHPIVPAR